MNKWLIVLFFLAAVLAGLFAWRGYVQRQKFQAVQNSSDLISADDVHWHPQIKVLINGEAQLIPANIGIGYLYAGDSQYSRKMGMTEIHTHDDSGQIHLEMEGPVTKDEIKLGNFFRIWDKNFLEGKMKVTVNGQIIDDPANYLMKDKDEIEIRYE